MSRTLGTFYRYAFLGGFNILRSNLGVADFNPWHTIRGICEVVRNRAWRSSPLYKAHLPERFPLHFFSVEEAFEKGEGGGGGSGGHGGARWEGEKEEPATPARQGNSTRAAYGEDTIFSRIARQSGTAFWHTAWRAQNVNKTGKQTARPVTESAALARTRVRRFSIFPFTASPTFRKGLCATALGAKTLGRAPSPFLHPRLYRCISRNWPISLLACCACCPRQQPPCGSDDRGEGGNAKSSPTMGRSSAHCSGWVKR